MADAYDRWQDGRDVEHSRPVIALLSGISFATLGPSSAHGSSGPPGSGAAASERRSLAVTREGREHVPASMRRFGSVRARASDDNGLYPRRALLSAASASIRHMTLWRGRSASSPGEPRGDPGRVTTASVKNGSSWPGQHSARSVVRSPPARSCLMLRAAAITRFTCLRPTGPARALEVNGGAGTVSTG